MDHLKYRVDMKRVFTSIALSSVIAIANYSYASSIPASMQALNLVTQNMIIQNSVLMAKKNNPEKNSYYINTECIEGYLYVDQDGDKISTYDKSGNKIQCNKR